MTCDLCELKITGLCSSGTDMAQCLFYDEQSEKHRTVLAIIEDNKYIPLASWLDENKVIDILEHCHERYRCVVFRWSEENKNFSRLAPDE